MRKLQQGVERVAIAISSVILGVMMIILIYNVFARFLGGGISWYMEASQYLNVWAMMIVGVGICATGSHLRISALDEVLKGRAKKVNGVIVNLATIAFYALFTYGSYLLAVKSRQSVSTMPMLKMSYVYWIMPICGGLSALSTLLHLILMLKGEDEPVEKEGWEEGGVE